MSHTKGPWCVESAMGDQTDIALAYEIPGEGSPLVIACCFPGEKDDEESSGPPSHKEAKANARLMAAAPDLLEACRRAASYARLNRACPPPDSTSLDIAELCESAIAKAVTNG